MSRRHAATADPDSRHEITLLGAFVCVLIVGVHWHEDSPLVLAANRDEAYARRATAPTAEDLHGVRALLPRDEQAGGTWIGINAAGLIAALTNRRDGEFDRQRRSRGLLCREILSQPNVEAAERLFAESLSLARYNSFNLLIADREEVALATWNGESQVTRLGPGVHVLSNEHVLGELAVPELGRPSGLQGAELRRLLVEALGSHVPRDERGFRLCKHGEAYGTVSASLVYRRRDGSLLFEHAPGPPCITPFVLHRLG